MFSTTEEDDGADFLNISSNATGSNLASLFGASLPLKQNDNISLLYNAPKNPKLITEEASKTNSLQSCVICTAFVEAFSISPDKNQTSHGKCGLAIIGNDSVKIYDIIVYKSKDNVIMRTKLKSGFIFILKDNNFASFNDDQKQKWTIHFQNIIEMNKFVEKVQECGAKMSRKIDEKVTKLKDETKHNDGDATSDSSDSKTRASILSRMAKMGQNILPTNLPAKSDKPVVTDSETDESVTIKKPTVKKRHKINTNNGDSVSKPIHPEYVIVNGQLVPVSSLQSTVSMVSTPVHNQLAINHPQLSLSDPLNIFIAENRTHNCELRMNMSQLSSKLETILTKLDKSGTNIGYENDLQATIAEKDSKIAEKNRLYEDLQLRYDNLSKTNSNYEEIIRDYQQEIEKQKNEILIQNNKIEELTCLSHKETLKSDQHLSTINDLNTSIDKLKAEISIINNSKINDFEIEELRNSVKTLQDEIRNRNSKADLFSKTLMQSMNVLYQDIMENFEENTSFSGNQIKTVLAKKLKMSTLNIIQDFNKAFNDASTIDHSNQEIKEAPPIPEF